MRVVSMIVDHYYDRWEPYCRQPPYNPTAPGLPGYPYTWPDDVKIPVEPVKPHRVPSAEEIAEFYDLLRKAREYDKKNHEPDCESEEKKKKLQALADELGVKITIDS